MVAEPAVAGWIDYVLTFEEVGAMFAARDIDLETIDTTDVPDDGTADGRGFAVSGGVLAAVGHVLGERQPDLEFQTDRAESLSQCRKLLLQAKAGKRPKFLLEGMACPGGCVGGAGTMFNQNQANAKVKAFARASARKSAQQTLQEAATESPGDR